MPFFCVALDGGGKGDSADPDTSVASSSSSAPTVNEEIILEQVLGTCRGHKIGVGRTLSQRAHSGASSSSSSLEGSTVCVDLVVEEYLPRSYE